MGDQLDQAWEPEEVGRLFLERLNAGDTEGLAQLYEREAVLAAPSGQVTTGREAIRQLYAQMLDDNPVFDAGEHKPVLRLGEVALS